MKEYLTSSMKCDIVHDRYESYLTDMYEMVQKVYTDYHVQTQDKITLEIGIHIAHTKDTNILFPTQKADRFMRELFLNLNYPLKQWVKPHLHLTDRVVVWNWCIERYGVKRKTDHDDDDENKRCRF